MPDVESSGALLLIDLTAILGASGRKTCKTIDFWDCSTQKLDELDRDCFELSALMRQLAIILFARTGFDGSAVNQEYYN